MKILKKIKKIFRFIFREFDREIKRMTPEEKKKAFNNFWWKDWF